MRSPTRWRAMLGHFLKRDFRDFLLWWVLLGIVTTTCALLHLVSGDSLGPALLPFGYFLLFFAYIMFANLPMSYVLGSLWRTQHGWSRHYLLALPLSHWKLFGILHARMAVFWLPLIIAASAGGVLFGWALRLSARQWTLSCLGLFTSVVVWMEMNIWWALLIERIRGYISAWSRVRAWASMIAVTYGVMGLLGMAWSSLLVRDDVASHLDAPWLLAVAYSPGASWALFPVSLVVAALWARWNARRWCVTLGSVKRSDPA
jgi:hypothetical protein